MSCLYSSPIGVIIDVADPNGPAMSCVVRGAGDMAHRRGHYLF